MREFMNLVEKAIQTFSPEFKRWFGNSKVVDEHGQPERVFHGTAASIDKFQHSGNGAGSRESRLGYWFTENTDAAAQFAAFARPNGAGSNIVPVYLSIQNPWLPESYSEIMDLVDRHTAFERKMIMGGRNIRMVSDKVDYAGAVAELRAQGYDGIILRNTATDAPSAGEKINQYIIFNPNQAKSVFNAGGYNPDSDHLSEDEAMSPAQQLIDTCKGNEYVTLSMSAEDEHNVAIDDFWSEIERGKGHASAVLRHVVDTADKLGVGLWLTASPLHYDNQWGDYDDDPRDIDALNKQALNIQQLVKFYEKFGFKVIYGDTNDQPTMERKPNIRP